MNWIQDIEFIISTTMFYLATGTVYGSKISTNSSLKKRKSVLFPQCDFISVQLSAFLY